LAAELALEIRGLVAGYEDITVLRGIDLALAPSTITAVIGANGAGKSTLLKAIFGLVHATAGTLRLFGEDVTHLGTSERLRRGLVIVPQGRCNFPLMSVQENLEMGAYTRHDRRVRADIEGIYGSFELLDQRRRVLAGNLSGGEQQLLEMAMALMVHPRIILLDEPSLGLSPGMQEQVFAAISKLRDLGTTVLMVEQNAVQALRIAQRGIVLELGKVSHDGTGAAMLDNPEVRRAYLGLPA
jgi:ABC-type branched-subunit amino acid transport system ATPase component